VKLEQAPDYTIHSILQRKQCLFICFNVLSAKPEKLRKPRKPKSPDFDRCCAKACDTCFLNPYYEKMEKYEAALAEWEAQQKEINKNKKEKKKKKGSEPVQKSS